MTHPERLEEIRPDYGQPWTATQQVPHGMWSIVDAVGRTVAEGIDTHGQAKFICDLAASEKRASEAERTFADLRNLIEANFGVVADLVRERDEARKYLANANTAICSHAEEILQALSERDEARAAFGKVVEALKNARTLIGFMPIKHPQQAEDKMKLIAQIDAALKSNPKDRIYWDEAEGCFVVPEGACPYPINGDDGSVESCRAHGNCGCDGRNPATHEEGK